MNEMIGMRDRIFETEQAERHFSMILKLSSKRLTKYWIFSYDCLIWLISLNELMNKVMKNSVINGDSEDIMQFSIKVKRLECTPNISVSFLIIRKAIMFFFDSLTSDFYLKISKKLYFESYFAINKSFLLIS